MFQVEFAKCPVLAGLRMMMRGMAVTFHGPQCYLPMRWNCAPMHGKAEEELVSRSRCEPIHNVLWTPVKRRGLAEQRCMQCGRDSLEMISLD